MEPGRLSPPAGGFVWADGAVYTVTANQVTQGGEDLGKLSVGRTFDLGDFETPAVLLHGDKVLLSAVPAIPAQEIERGLKACKGRQDCQLSLANANYLITKLDGSWGADSCALISLESLDKATGPVAARLRSIFVTAGIGALGFALLGSLLSARAIVQPLAIMISHLHASEKSGDLSELNFGPEAIKEVRELTASFNRAASAIRRSKEDLQHAYLEFTGSLASALDARDFYTAGHSQRVSEYSCAIAESLGLSAREVGDIRIGALLHDIGKIGVSDSVLQKPGRLTSDEFALIQMHPTIGRRILEGVNGFHPYLAVVELHHENWDGTGYPRGISGQDVPLAARIVHVADAFDAMTSDRPYRRGMSVSEAFGILNRFAGTQFDPAIVGAFLNLGLGTSGLMRLHGKRKRGKYRGVETGMKLATAFILTLGVCFGQEAQSGFQVEGTFSAGTEYTRQLSAQPRDGSPWAAGMRLVLYPQWKIGGHWSFISAVQLRSRPYFFQEFATQGYGLRSISCRRNLPIRALPKIAPFRFAQARCRALSAPSCCATTISAIR